MEKNKRGNLYMTITAGICAVLNIILVIRDVCSGAILDTGFVLHILCAVMWCISAVASLVRSKKQDKGEDAQ